MNNLKHESGYILKRNYIIRILLVYPNIYYIGMSNLGFQTIYREINSRYDCFCERAFIEKNKITHSIETSSDLKKFDIIAFSISYESDIYNIITSLKKAGLDHKSAPFLLTGGLASPIIFNKYRNLFDFILPGEAEENIHLLLDLFISNKHKKTDKASLINILYDYFNNIITPGKILVNNLPNVDIKNSPAFSQVLTPNTLFGNTMLFELTRGCINRCNFCYISHIQKKFRYTNFEKILEIIDNRKNIKRVGLISTAITAYKNFDMLIESLLKRDIKISMSSLDLTKLNDKLIDIISKTNQKTVTIAPETPNEKIRVRCGKKITNEDIFSAIEKLFLNGILNIKFYFIIGLLDEITEEFNNDLIKFIRKTWHIMQKTGKTKKTLGNITFNINPLIPKPYTLYENQSIMDYNTYKNAVDKIKKEFLKIPNIRISYLVSKQSFDTCL